MEAMSDCGMWSDLPKSHSLFILCHCQPTATHCHGSPVPLLCHYCHPPLGVAGGSGTPAVAATGLSTTIRR